MIKAIIFDMDGLLIDTEKYHTACWIAAAREQGFEMTMETALKLRSLGAEFAEPMLQEEFGEELDYEKLRLIKRTLMEKRLYETPAELKKGAVELLSWLSGQNCKKAVATATRREKAEECLKSTGLWSYFDAVLSVTGVAHGKPMPDVYLEACKKLEEAPENCLALEDSPNGAWSAVRAGCRTVMIPDLTPVPEELKGKLFGEAGSLLDLIDMIRIEIGQGVDITDYGRDLNKDFLENKNPLYFV